MSPDRRAAALAFFVQQGWTLTQSAGIVANLEAESGLRPDAVGDGGAAYGLAQWHPPRQSNFAALMGKPIQGSSFLEQLHFVHAELRGEEKRAGDMLAQCTTAAEAAEVVCRYYERPADIGGDSRKRAALAEIIYKAAQEGAGAPPSEPVPPIPTPTPATPQAPVLPIPGGSMPAILTTLLPMVLSMFAPRAQAAITRATGNPAAADMLQPFLMDLFAKIGQTTGVVPPGQPVATDAQAVAAVAELQKLKAANSALVAEIEAHSLDYLDKLAPMFDRLQTISREEWAASEDSMDRAASRAMGSAYDPAPMLTHFSVGTVGILTFFLCAWITVLIVMGKPVGTEIWAALTGMIGWITAKLGGIYDNRFGTTRQSAAKDVVIQQLSQSRK